MKKQKTNLSLAQNAVGAFLLILTVMLAAARPATAQSLTTLHEFEPTPSNNFNSEGANPLAGLILSGNTLYGTANKFGIYGKGTVFKVNTDGTDFTVLHSFTATSGSLHTNADGANPDSRLIISGDTLYGTTEFGGISNRGTVFAINTDGTGFTNLHNFTGGSSSADTDGKNPYGGLVLSGGILYGTTQNGPAGVPLGNGMVFAMNTDGTGFTNLHSFSGDDDGGNPQAGLIVSGNTLFGTARTGGENSADSGTVFALNTDGTGFTNLHSFSLATGAGATFNFTNDDGKSPLSELVLSGATLYGTTTGGGGLGRGTVFAVNTDGTGFRNLHNFTRLTGTDSTNSDGANPSAPLIISGGTLYGTARYGGDFGLGTVFALNTDGTGYTTLYSFKGNDGVDNIGNNPFGGLLPAGGILYGTTSGGGGWGTVFRLSLPFGQPQLSIVSDGASVILTWPSDSGIDFSGFSLQSTPDLVSGVWSPVSPAPVIVGGQFTVTNAISGAQTYYRLIQ